MNHIWRITYLFAGFDYGSVIAVAARPDSAAPKSEADVKRSAGSFSSAFATAALTFAGTVRRKRDGAFRERPALIVGLT